MWTLEAHPTYTLQCECGFREEFQLWQLCVLKQVTKPLWVVVKGRNNPQTWALMGFVKAFSFPSFLPACPSPLLSLEVYAPCPLFFLNTGFGGIKFHACKRMNWGWVGTFESSKPTLTDTLPPEKPTPKQHDQLGPSSQMSTTEGEISHSNHYISFSDLHSLMAVS